MTGKKFLLAYSAWENKPQIGMKEFRVPVQVL